MNTEQIVKALRTLLVVLENDANDTAIKIGTTKGTVKSLLKQLTPPWENPW